MLDGDVKARGFFNDYLLGLSDQAEDNNHYTRVKYVKVTEFSSVVVDGKNKLSGPQQRTGQPDGQ